MDQSTEFIVKYEVEVKPGERRRITMGTVCSLPPPPSAPYTIPEGTFPLLCQPALEPVDYGPKLQTNQNKRFLL